MEKAIPPENAPSTPGTHLLLLILRIRKPLWGFVIHKLLHWRWLQRQLRALIRHPLPV
jgi:hypothetical protein